MDDAEIMAVLDRIAEKIVDAIEANTIQQIEIVGRLERIINALGNLIIDDD